MGRMFRVGCVQNCATDDVDANLARVADLVDDAVAQGAELVCLPEFFCCLERDDRAYWEHGHVADEHPALARARELARGHGVWLVIGSIPVRFHDGKVHNRSFVLDATGTVTATYNKVHLFDVAIKDGQDYLESRCVAPGDRAVTCALPWGRLGLTICYDVRFPYLYRRLAQGGADFITVPAAFTAKTGAAHWHVLVRARAIETGCYVFAPGQCGTRPWGRRTYGHSLIVNPWGDVLADGGEEEGVIVADIDPAQVTQVRQMIPALLHDREVTGPGPSDAEPA